jgi:hypothetical protein
MYTQADIVATAGIIAGIFVTGDKPSPVSFLLAKN